MISETETMAAVNPSNLLPMHTKAGRALLDWTANDLAANSSVGISTVKVFESGKSVRDVSKQAMIDALEGAGVKLYNGGQPGARLIGNPNA